MQENTNTEVCCYLHLLSHNFLALLRALVDLTGETYNSNLSDTSVVKRGHRCNAVKNVKLIGLYRSGSQIIYTIQKVGKY